MSEKVIIESIFAKRTLTSTGGMKTAIREFLTTHPDDVYGTIIIRGVSRQWYTESGNIKLVR